MYTFSFIVGNIIAKSVKCIHSATKEDRSSMVHPRTWRLALSVNLFFVVFAVATNRNTAVVKVVKVIHTNTSTSSRCPCGGCSSRSSVSSSSSLSWHCAYTNFNARLCGVPGSCMVSGRVAGGSTIWL